MSSARTWTPERRAELAQHLAVPGTKVWMAAIQMGISRSAASAATRYYRLRPGTKDRWPSGQEYERVMRRAVEAVPGAVMRLAVTDAEHEPSRLARWIAWRELKDCSYTQSGIAHVSGFHHTSVLYALRQIEGM